MSKARVQLLPAGEIEVQLALDVLIAAGSRQAYYELSRVPDPLESSRVQQVLAKLPSAIHISIGDQRVPLALTDIRFPSEPESVFLDPLAWPRTELVLRGSLAGLPTTPSDSGLQIAYGASFRFEEPIANTVEDTVTGVTQTRWLVTGQTSPTFDASRWVDRDLPVPATQGVDWYGVLDFVRTGTLHILPGGVDHLLFVAGLCLGASSLAALVGVISLFTLAHSLTLCAMVLGWVDVPSAFVEAMVLLSILWVAVANLLGHGSGRWRFGVVVIFGLLHGLGFAGALLELDLPSNAVIAALLAFNLGVEIGQIGFVLALVVTLGFLRRASKGVAQLTLVPIDASSARTGSWVIAFSAIALLLLTLLPISTV